MPSLSWQKRKYYSAFGLLWESEIKIPGFLDASASSKPDVRILFGKAQETLRLPFTRSFRHDFAAQEAIIRFSSALAFYVCNGNTIIIDADPSLTEDMIRAILIHFPIVTLLIQRGFYTLHGASAIIDGRVVLFLGHSGEGKSALLYEFWRRGIPIIADDICAISLAKAVPTIVPGIQCLLVWKDTIEADASADQAHLTLRDGINKYMIEFSNEAQTQPTPIDQFCILHEQNMKDFSVREIRGYNRFKCTYPYYFHNELSEIVMGKEALFQAHTRIFSSTPILEISKNKDVLSVKEYAEKVLSEFVR